jgi:hypothetical protein
MDHVKIAEALHRVREERLSYIQNREGSLTGWVASRVGTDF